MAQSRLTRCENEYGSDVWRCDCVVVVVLSGEDGSKDTIEGPHNKRSRHCWVVVVVVVAEQKLGRKEVKKCLCLSTNAAIIHMRNLKCMYVEGHRHRSFRFWQI